jgi:sugar (pentulose or hexulose) kinase
MKPVVAIFDVGKTNKKLFLFDEQYRMVFERTARFTETADEDGFPCENLESLRLSVFDSLREVFRKKLFDIRAINFSTYGASFVYIDDDGFPLTPLYNYLKPYPETISHQFYQTYGGEQAVSQQTASPVLGSLNSGLQLYRLKYEQPELFKKIRYALHLPQYMSYLISGYACSDLTSIGCHTHLWDFQQHQYHQWVQKEGLHHKLAPIVSSDTVVPAAFPGNGYHVGIGLHDSSAALIPYLVNFQEPFVLISSGTWCISLNPFNHSLLTPEELNNDCLCYLQYQGKPVKASRLFAGHEHDEQVKRIAEHFQLNQLFFRNISYNPELVTILKKKSGRVPLHDHQVMKASAFGQRDMTDFANEEEAYHQLIIDLIEQQALSTKLVLTGTDVKRIFVDGGFSKNAIYMNLLAAAFPDIEVYAASMAQATALGTALAVHHSWNKRPIPNDLIELKYYALTQDMLQ